MSLFSRFKKPPASGIVKEKLIDPPRSKWYSELVGTKVINEKPIYWLVVQPAGAKKKKRNVPVTKDVFDAHKVGDEFSAK